jgi:hypothetical protein
MTAIITTTCIAPLPAYYQWPIVNQSDIDREVHVRYRAVDRLLSELRELYTVQNAGRPVNKLPTDILVVIMQQYLADTRVYDEIGRRKASDSPYEWFKLGAVCRYWREVLLRHPLLWTDITLTSPACLDIILARSAEAPLHVISAPGNWEVRAKCYAVLLHKARHRIKHLDVVLPPESGIVSLGSAAAELQDPSIWNLPALESIYINAFHGFEVALVQLACGGLVHSPLLRRMDIQSASWAVASAGVRPGLTTLRMSNTFPRLRSAEWIDALQTTPDLDTLELTNAVCDLDTASDRIPAEPILLPQLKRLRLSASTSKVGESNANLLGRLVLPSLSKISLSVSADVDCRRLFAAIAAKCSAIRLVFARIAYDIDWMTVDFWTSEHPMSAFLSLPTLPSVDALYPSPPCLRLFVRSKPSNSPKPLLPELIRVLPVLGVSSLLVHGAARVKSAEDSWISLAPIHNLRRLCIVGTDPTRSFLGVFKDSPIALDSDSAPTSLFPKLETLQLAGVDWAVPPQFSAQDGVGNDAESAEDPTSVVELLVEALEGRQTRNLPSLKCLHVVQPHKLHMRHAGRRDLRDLVAEVDEGLD